MTQHAIFMPRIAVYAPDALADTVLRGRLPIIKERYPSLRIRLNPQAITHPMASVYLGFNHASQTGFTSRRIGSLTSRTYINSRDGSLSVLPDIIAGFDPTLSRANTEQSPIIDELHLSFDPAIGLVPGVRQTLDWVESCVISLAWLNATDAA